MTVNIKNIAVVIGALTGIVSLMAATSLAIDKRIDAKTAVLDSRIKDGKDADKKHEEFEGKLLKATIEMGKDISEIKGYLKAKGM